MNLLIFNLKTDADDSILGFTTDWINAMAAYCNRVFVITMVAGRIAVAENVQVFSIGKEKGFSEPRRLLEFYRLLWRVLRTAKIDACLAHMMPLFSVLGWPLLRPKRIPIVLWYAHSHVSLLLRVATKVVDRIVASSKSGFGIETAKFRSIGQGIDVNRFVPVHRARADNRLVLLTVGRISPVKRLEIVIESLALLPAEIKENVELRFIGDPLGSKAIDYMNTLQRRVSDLGLSHIVKFQTALPFHQVVASYQNADVFINNSDTDSIDKTVLEAMSCGIPVITSNAAFPLVLGDQLAKQCCVPKNNAQILAARIIQIAFASQEERSALGKRLREIVVRDHSLNKLAKRLFSEINNSRWRL